MAGTPLVVEELRTMLLAPPDPADESMLASPVTVPVLFTKPPVAFTDAVPEFGIAAVLPGTWANGLMTVPPPLTPALPVT